MHSFGNGTKKEVLKMFNILLSGIKKIALLLIYFTLVSTSLNAEVKIMPLGDSITWDWHYDDYRMDSQRSGYRNYLWYKLKDAGFDVNFVGSRNTGAAVRPTFDGDNEGYTGYTSYQIANIIYHLLEKNTPDIVLLHIGTNDSIRYSSDDISGIEKILNEVDRFEKNKHTKIKVILARIIYFQEPGIGYHSSTEVLMLWQIEELKMEIILL